MIIATLFIGATVSAQEAVIDSVATAPGTEYFIEKSGNDTFSIQERRVSHERLARLRSSKDFWYADSSPEKKTADSNHDKDFVPLGQQTWFQVLLWIVIIGAFASAIVWYLAGNNIRLFRKKSDSITGTLNDEQMPEDIFAIQYQREIDKAVSHGNYRLAVRLLFLKLLKELSDKQIIQYKQDRTNLDYLLQLNQSKLYSTFARLTRHYEYSWYGHFDVGQHAYELIHQDFENMKKEIEINRT